MADVLPKPKIFRNDQNIQLSHETSHRIHDAAYYPLLSSNGSSIILYGHENGVRIIWKGGRPFKPSAALGDKPKTNGAQGDSLMIIDSDDEQSGPPFTDRPEFEDDDEEPDPSLPYPRIVQYLDLNFGATILHIAVPPISKTASDATFGLGPPMLKDQLVFATVCSDHKARLVTLPLTPPSPASKSRQDLKSSLTVGNAGNGKWGETVLELIGNRVPSDGVAITFSRVTDASSTNAGGAAARSSSQARSKGSEWQLLVASHYREGPGRLLIHRIPVTSTRKGGGNAYTLSREHNAPYHNISLSSPATKVSFNPHTSSASQSTHLLVADRTGACRIYDCRLSQTLAQSGSWLFTMFTGFYNSKSDINAASLNSSPAYLGRKSIVDAEWVMGGKAIMVLLADGEWGVWDVEGAGPGGSTKAIFVRQGIKGGALTAFSISGWIDSTLTKSISTKSSTIQASSSKFAPMTPGTRKTAEPVLFNGKSSQGFTRGQISICRLPTTSATSLVEESVAFWLEDSYFLIPNLRAYWEAQSRRAGGTSVSGSGTLFSGGPSTSRLIRLEGINMRGERCCGIAQHPREVSSNSKASLPTEILVVGEHRYLIVSDRAQVSRGLKRRLMSSENEYQVTASRELDVMEIDQVLEQMENGHSDSSLQPMRKSGFMG